MRQAIDAEQARLEHPRCPFLGEHIHEELEPIFSRARPLRARKDETIVESLVRNGVVVATPLGSARWELRAGPKVGVARIGGVTVWVKPKVTIARLLWLLGSARKAVFEAPGPVSLEEADELVPALAEAFYAQAERALQAGLLKGYREVEGAETVLRGQLRTGDQLRRRFGLAVPLLVRYDDHLVDIAENQILKAAGSRLLTLPGMGGAVRSRLQRLRGLLVDVGDVVGGPDLPTWHPTRLNARYHDALLLARNRAGRRVDRAGARTCSPRRIPRRSLPSIRGLRHRGSVVGAGADRGAMPGT